MYVDLLFMQLYLYYIGISVPYILPLYCFACGVFLSYDDH